MKTTSLQELKKELIDLSAAELLELILKLAKHKKENKELLGYLLFDARDETVFIENTKELMGQQFMEMNRSNVYLAKKSLRKVLRTMNKYIKFSGSPLAAVELISYFMIHLKKSGLPMAKNTVIGNMYEQQMKKINSHLSKMHEDLQYDYRKRLEGLV